MIDAYSSQKRTQLTLSTSKIRTLAIKATMMSIPRTRMTLTITNVIPSTALLMNVFRGLKVIITANNSPSTNPRNALPVAEAVAAMVVVVRKNAKVVEVVVKLP